MKSLALAFVAAIMTACGSTNNNNTPGATVTTTSTPFPGGGGTAVSNGLWGGDHISLTVADSGASVSLDCARGDMEQPLVLDATSDFANYGFITQTEGPLRLDHPHVPHATLYKGSVQGNSVSDETISLNIQYVDDDGRAVNVDYSLAYGKQPRFAPCPL